MKIKKESRSLIDQINNWLKVYLPQTRCYSGNTIETYETALFLFIDFLESERHIKINEFNETCFNRDVIEEWLTWLSSKRNNQKRTRDQRLAIIRSMLRYLKSKNHSIVINYLDACEIRNISHGRGKKVEGLSKKAMKAFFADIDCTTRTGKRDYAMFTLMYDTGCRIGEELNIKVKDLYLDVGNPYLIVNGKGNKKRPLILSEKTVEIIRLYIKMFLGNNPNSEAYLFYSSHGGIFKLMSEDAVNNRLYIISEKANKKCAEVPVHMHCHQIRHSSASHWLQDDINIAQISRYLGHESLETTRIYLGISREELEQALAKREVLIDDQKKKYRNVQGGLKSLIGRK
ncbi:MAG: tyrosine-type recombinase/integrase [Patescibacteria group bacterium]